MKSVKSTFITGFAIASYAALFLAGLLPQSSFAQTDPWIGTWRLNVAKSTFNPGPGPRSQTVTSESIPGGYRLLVDGVDAQGRQQKNEVPLIFDGRQHPVIGSPATDTITSRMVDPYTQQFEYFKDGKTDGTATQVISRDGRIVTYIFMRLLNNGRQNIGVAVYDKQ